MQTRMERFRRRGKGDRILTMKMRIHQKIVLGALLTLGSQGAHAWATDDPTDGDLQAQIRSLKARMAQLEARQNETWLTEERASQIRGIVEDVLKDGRRGGRRPRADGGVQRRVFHPDAGWEFQADHRRLRAGAL